jgi:hypothetical protein
VTDTPRTDEFFYERARRPGVNAWLRYARTIERELDAALAALDAALAGGSEMSPIGDDCRQVAPEPDAKREPATNKEIDAEWLKIKPVLYPMYGLGDFRDGFRAAERHHGITKEDK